MMSTHKLPSLTTTLTTVDLTDSKAETSETQKQPKLPLVCDEDSGLGMDEHIQNTDSPFLCSSFGGLLSIADEETHNTSLSELHGKLPKLKNSDSSLAKRALFNQKRQLETETPRIPSKRQCRPKHRRSLKTSLSFGDSPQQKEDSPQQKENFTAVVDKLFDEEHLIADGSKPYSLPTVTGKHRDLTSITSETVVDLLSGKYNDVIENYRILDCRYPFEYEGGHIQGAENLYTQENILALLEENKESPESNGKRDILIFHCEFSSERGPKMCRLLRNKDREVNAVNYPKLTYPEIYLLDAGYKAFYYNKKEFCEPMSYKPMLHEDHTEDVRKFRTKSKSWTAGEKRKNLTRILF